MTPESVTSAEPHATRQASPVGRLLREWRASRGLSQLDLAMRAGFSSRHVSFIETGRTQPSRQALIALAETLDVPLRERNRLLEAGGYAHVYRQTPLAAEEMRHIRGVLQFILDRHEPYGAVVLDRYSNLLMANDASRALLGTLVDAALSTGTPNLLRMVFHPQGLRRFIVNWDQVARYLWSRAQHELTESRNDETAATLLAEIRELAGPSARGNAPGTTELLLPVHLKAPGLEIRLFSAIMTLGTPQDVTLQELRIETFFPADEESEARLRSRVTSPSR